MMDLVELQNTCKKKQEFCFEMLGGLKDVTYPAVITSLTSKKRNHFFNGLARTPPSLTKSAPFPHSVSFYNLMDPLDT